MIRLPNSYNSKRGCWSIPLSSEEVMELSHDDLVELSQTPRTGYIGLGSVPLTLKLPKKEILLLIQRRKGLLIYLPYH